MTCKWHLHLLIETTHSKQPRSLSKNHQMICSTLNTLLFVHFAILTAVLAITGPHPSDIHPTYETPDLAKIDIPLHPGITNPPKITYLLFGRLYFKSRQDEISVGIKDTGTFRFRLLEYRTKTTPQGSKIISTHVLKAVVNSNGRFRSVVDNRCKLYSVYIEICARISGKSRPLCSMTDVKTVQRFSVPEPRLEFRPPYALHLAPGDRARIITMTKPHYTGGPYWVRAIIKKGLSYLETGKIIKKFRQSHRRSDANISRKDTRRSGGTYLNNTNIVFSYAVPSCRSNEDTSRWYTGTKLYISNKVMPLIRQDNRLPEFDPIKVPLVKQGQNVSITVNARNVGGGLRKGGVPTKLDYLWFQLSISYQGALPHTEMPIAEGPTLLIENARCYYPVYSHWNPWTETRYLLRVCNTYGCKASKLFAPEFFSDIPGKKIAFNCSVVDI